MKFADMTYEQMAAFAAEFGRLSGIDESQSPMPWCCPWIWATGEVDGSTPEEAAAAWWAECREEIEDACRAEDESLKEYGE